MAAVVERLKTCLPDPARRKGAVHFQTPVFHRLPRARFGGVKELSPLLVVLSFSCFPASETKLVEDPRVCYDFAAGWSVVRGPWSVVRGPWSVVRGPVVLIGYRPRHIL